MLCSSHKWELIAVLSTACIPVHSVELQKMLKISITKMKRIGLNSMNYAVFCFSLLLFRPSQAVSDVAFCQELFQKHFRHCFPRKELWFSRSDSPAARCKWGSIFGNLARLRLCDNKALTRGNLLVDLSFFPWIGRILLPNFILKKNRETSLGRIY